MTKKIPPLGALRAFECASRHASFVRAAEELNVTPAAVSHQVKQLEQWLRVSLFERKTNGVALTAAGRDYALRIRDVFEQLVMTSRAVRENRVRTVVTIRAQHSITTMWLLPKVAALNAQQSDIELRLFVAADRPSAKVDADITVFHQRADSDGFRQDLLVRGNFKVYAAPSLVARMEHPTPAVIATQPLVHNNFEERGWRYPSFEDWFSAAGVIVQPMLPGLHVNLLHLATSACLQGVGFALLLDEFCLDHVRAGSLVALSGPAIVSPHPYYVRSKKSASEEVKYVRDWLLNHAVGNLFPVQHDRALPFSAKP